MLYFVFFFKQKTANGIMSGDWSSDVCSSDLGQGMDVQYLIAEICGSGLLLGAFFMATDYVTSPITKRGQMIYGIALGMITGVFRIYSGSAEGVSYAIIFCNLLVPLIEKVTIPKAFGREALRREK